VISPQYSALVLGSVVSSAVAAATHLSPRSSWVSLGFAGVPAARWKTKAGLGGQGGPWGHMPPVEDSGRVQASAAYTPRAPRQQTFQNCHIGSVRDATAAANDREAPEVEADVGQGENPLTVLTVPQLERFKRILALAEQLPQIWKDPRVDFRERKRIARLLLDDVTLIKAQTPMCGCPAGYAHIGARTPLPIA
jgi:hypothetical protein